MFGVKAYPDVNVGVRAYSDVHVGIRAYPDVHIGVRAYPDVHVDVRVYLYNLYKNCNKILLSSIKPIYACCIKFVCLLYS